MALTVIFVLRPLSVLVSFVGSSRTPAERVFLAWFGVRRLASLYYAAAVAATGVLSEAHAAPVWWTAVATVVVSIVVHGLTGTRGVDLVERAHRLGRGPSSAAGAAHRHDRGSPRVETGGSG